MSELLWLFGVVATICALCNMFSAENRESADSWMRFMDEQDKKKKTAEEEKK